MKHILADFHHGYGLLTVPRSGVLTLSILAYI
jgi:hypothetical protein